MKNVTRFIFVSLLLAAVTCLTACNTMKGVGQDVQNAGTAIENAAKK